MGGATLASCDDYLDKTPDNRATVDTEEKVAALLTSAYPENTFAYVCEMSSDNIDYQDEATLSTYSYLEEECALWKDITTTSNDSPYQIWNAHYMAAAAANQALEAIDELGNPESLNGEKGEALMCRAYAHWVLVNVFCLQYNPDSSDKDLGIKYSTEPETVLIPSTDRGTVAEVYKHIDEDIQEALPLLDDAHITVPKYHFTKKASLAFAVRFYLGYTQKDGSNYDKAIKYADELFGNTPTSLLRDWATVGAKDVNKEVRAKAYIDASDQANLLLMSTYSNWNLVHGAYTYAQKFCHDEVIASTETCAATPWGTKSDMNFYIPSYSMKKVIMAKIPYYFEITNVVAQTGFRHNIYPMLTGDEVLLNRAEAYALKGDFSNAANDLNIWASRFYKNAPTLTADQIAAFYEDMAYYTPTDPTPKKALNPEGFTVAAGEQENMIHAILAARRVLLLHEGYRWFDIKRYGIELYRRAIKSQKIMRVVDTLPKGDKRRAIQLPESVISAGVEANPR
jgi:hypothetical protein